jgi:DNA-directed RNA polymerase specialized sigma24 family protein
VIALRFGQELSLAETAEILEKTVGAVKALQHRALDSLARFMPDQGGEV